MSASDPRRAEPFVDGLHFGECPRWHDGRLWYADFFARTVSSAGPAGDVRVEVEEPGEPAGLGWLPDGTLLVASRRHRTVRRVGADGVPVDHASLDDPAFFRLNDLVVDDAGRAYVGNFGFDLDAFLADPAAVPMAPTRLVRVDPDGSTTTAAEDLLFPNGMVITPDGGTLVVAETFASHLTAFDRAADGTLSGRRVWAPLPGVAPDGICLDADGHVWVANALADECLLLAEGGGILDRVVTSRPCFACMLGGEDRRTLYLVTATSSLEALASRRRLGRIEQVRVDVPGTGRP